MCNVKRRDFLAAGAATFLSAAAERELLAGARPIRTPPAAAQEVAPGVFFYESDIAKVGSNSGWVIFDDYVLVIDTTYPAGAREVIGAVRATTDKPIRFAFDTHHHGDHLYGNQVYADQGTTDVAHVGVLDELRRYETGYYGKAPGRWEAEAKEREDVRASRFKPPSVLFPNQLFFDDGKRRVELMHLGVAHTHGDAFAWLPKRACPVQRRRLRQRRVQLRWRRTHRLVGQDAGGDAPARRPGALPRARSARHGRRPRRPAGVLQETD